MCRIRSARAAIFVLLFLLAFSVVSAPRQALAQGPTPTPTQASSGINFRDYIKIEALGKSLTADMVLPGTTFYADLSTNITWIGNSDPPFPVSLLKNYSVTALYQIVGAAKDGSGEQVLGTSEMTIGPFRDVKMGDKFSFQQHPSLVFSDKSPFGDYTVLVRPSGAKGGPLNAFGMAWPMIKGGLPQEYAIGVVNLVKELPTPTPTPAPTATPTPAPASTPPAATPSPAATSVAAASPGPLPTPTPRSPAATPAAGSSPTSVPAAPSQDAPGAGTGWPPMFGVAVLALTFVGLVVGASLNRRFKAPGGRL